MPSAVQLVLLDRGGVPELLESIGRHRQIALFSNMNQAGITDMPT